MNRFFGALMYVRYIQHHKVDSFKDIYKNPLKREWSDDAKGSSETQVEC